jgi:alanine racemase
MFNKTFFHPSWVEINLKQLKKNLAIIKSNLKGSLFCFPIKANAYGHGLVSVAKAAQDSGVDYLGVAHLQEAMKLKEANIHKPVLILGAIHEDQIIDAINHGFEFTISSKYKADLVAAKCQSIQKKCRIHIEIDTGMQRTGVRVETAASLFQHLKSLGCFEVVGIYSHFVNSDNPKDPITSKQIEGFLSLKKNPVFQNSSLIWHISNSGGVVFFPHANLDMVRPGLIAFGYLPENYPPSFEGIAPCYSVKSKVSYFKVVKEKEGISYGHSYFTKKQTRIVTVPIGYGDGYRRGLSNKGSVIIRGKKFPIVGTICMDQFMVDVGDEEIYVGDEVTLIGKEGEAEITAREIANLCETNIYEVLCFFNDRLKRVYVD